MSQPVLETGLVALLGPDGRFAESTVPTTLRDAANAATAAAALAQQAAIAAQAAADRAAADPAAAASAQQAQAAALAAQQAAALAQQAAAAAQQAAAAAGNAGAGVNQAAVDQAIANLAQVARSGEYADLKNPPAAPTKTTIGLGNVDNTRDADKPISTLQQQALDGKLPKTANVAALMTKVAGVWQPRAITTSMGIWVSPDGSNPPGGGTYTAGAGMVQGDLVLKPS